MTRTVNSRAAATTRPASNRTRWLAAAVLVACAVASTATLAFAEQIKLIPVEPSQPEQNATQPKKSNKQAPRPESVLLEGTLSTARGREIRMGNDIIMLSPSAWMMPGDSDRLPSLRELDGKAVTIFGVRTGNIVEAKLVLEHLDGGSLLHQATPVPPPRGKPSNSDPNVGELSSDTPE